MVKAAKFFSGQLTRELGLRYAPDLRFYKDNLIDQIREAETTAHKQIEEYQEQEIERQQIEKGELVGVFAELAKPMVDLKQTVAAFKRLSKPNQYQFLMSIQDPEERKAV